MIFSEDFSSNKSVADTQSKKLANKSHSYPIESLNHSQVEELIKIRVTAEKCHLFTKNTQRTGTLKLPMKALTENPLQSATLVQYAN